MAIIMDMDSGRYIAGEFGAFEDEVLNAQWLPQPVAPQLAMAQREAGRGSSVAMALDADAFLRSVYLSQE